MGEGGFSALGESRIIFEIFFEKIWWFEKTAVTLQRKSERDTLKQQKNHDSVAQLVEQMTLNHWVESSSLSGVT